MKASHLSSNTNREKSSKLCKKSYISKERKRLLTGSLQI